MLLVEWRDANVVLSEEIPRIFLPFWVAPTAQYDGIFMRINSGHREIVGVLNRTGVEESIILVLKDGNRCGGLDDYHGSLRSSKISFAGRGSGSGREDTFLPSAIICSTVIRHLAAWSVCMPSSVTSRSCVARMSSSGLRPTRAATLRASCSVSCVSCNIVVLEWVIKMPWIWALQKSALSDGTFPSFTTVKSLRLKIAAENNALVESEPLCQF